MVTSNISFCSQPAACCITCTTVHYASNGYQVCSSCAHQRLLVAKVSSMASASSVSAASSVTSPAPPQPCLILHCLSSQLVFWLAHTTRHMQQQTSTGCVHLLTVNTTGTANISGMCSTSFVCVCVCPPAGYLRRIGPSKTCEQRG